MSDFQLSIRGLDALVNKLTPLQAQDFLIPLVHRAVYRVHYTVAKYPTNKPPNSTYTRLGTLGRRWTTSVTRVTGGVTGRIGNNTSYGIWVQAKQYQVLVHRTTGWTTIEGSIASNQDRITRDFEFHIDQILRR